MKLRASVRSDGFIHLEIGDTPPLTIFLDLTTADLKDWVDELRAVQDKVAPTSLVHKMQELRAQCGRLVLGFFEGDIGKTDLWFATPNPFLGGTSPDDMLAMGEHHARKLLTWIREQLAENERPQL